MLYVLILGQLPFTERSPRDPSFVALQKGTTEDRKWFFDTKMKGLRHNTKRLIWRLLKFKPSDRPTPLDVKNDNFMDGKPRSFKEIGRMFDQKFREAFDKVNMQARQPKDPPKPA